jgi:hypothetical protein
MAKGYPPSSKKKQPIPKPKMVRVSKEAKSPKPPKEVKPKVAKRRGPQRNTDPTQEGRVISKGFERERGTCGDITRLIPFPDFEMPQLRSLPKPLFIDSGAFSLYKNNEHKFVDMSAQKENRVDWTFYESDAYYEYRDLYGQWLVDNWDVIDVAVTLDVIGNAELSHRNTIYLEETYGLKNKLMPVFHTFTPYSYLDSYLERGFRYIGVSDTPKGIQKSAIAEWQHKTWCRLCPKSNDYYPITKVHGFAMNNVRKLVERPYYSVDAASWLKAGGFGLVFLPSRNPDGSRNYLNRQRVIVSIEGTNNVRSFFRFSKEMQKFILDYFEEEGIKLGKWERIGDKFVALEKGVFTDHNYRKIANLHYFLGVQRAIPPWPRQYKRGVYKYDSLAGEPE